MLLTELKGVGEKTSLAFGKLGIDSVEKLLCYFPKNYDVYEKPVNIDDIDNKIVVAIDGIVMKRPDVKPVRNLQVISTTIKDRNGKYMKLTWFNMPFLKNMLKSGERFIFRGRVNKTKGEPILEQAEVFTLAKYDTKLNSMQPLYHLTKGVTNNSLIKAQKEALKNIDSLVREYLTEEEIERYSLMGRGEAYANIHFPTDMDVCIRARKRLAFDELFQFVLNMRMLKEKEIFVENNHVVSDYSVSNRIISQLPYELTTAQMRVIDDMRKDIASKKIMQRLIQGDVGSGKTIVAFLMMFDMANSGMQSVLMAPTEVLAEQHFDNMCKMIEDYDLDFKVELLTGSVKAAKKRKIYDELKLGAVDLLIGTHAVFQDNVEFKNLGLVITDEQHRFGVLQRAKLKEKGETPHTIVMSATPIPRTLAIILYGDLDVSVINELPASRLPIKNCVVTKEYRENAYRFIEREVNNGRQVYVICPMVEENDTIEAENVIDYSEKLNEIYAGRIKVDYLHGKMRPQEKNDIMRRFAEGETKILVSTTVIEVGINVPNATVMMVENADRFGLASLHQLRGRVGRGEHQSYCIFVSSSTKEEKMKRLEILNKSNDGFEIASEDLKMRGPGDFFGIRQSGEMEFQMADIYTDSDLIKYAAESVDLHINLENDLVDKQFNNDIVIY